MREFKKRLVFVCYRKFVGRKVAQLENYKATRGKFEKKERGESVDTESSLVPLLPEPEEIARGQWKTQRIRSEK